MTIKARASKLMLALLVLGIGAIGVLMVWSGVLISFDLMYNATNVFEYLVVQVWTASYFGAIGFVLYKLYKKVFKEK